MDTSFLYSWRAIAIYIALVIWTPIYPMRPLPPLRFDDLWLIYVFCMQLLSQQKASRAVNYFPFWGFIALGALAFLSTVLANVSNLSDFQIPDIYDSFIYIRLAIIMWIAGSIRLSAVEASKLLYAFVISSSLMYLVLCAQRYGLHPLAQITTEIWTVGEKYLLDFGTHGYSRRAVGTIGNPNYVSYFVWGNAATCLALLMLRGSSKTSTPNVVLLAIAVVSLPVTIFVLESRSALVCFVASSLYCVTGILLLGRKTRALQLLLTGMMVMVMVSVTWNRCRDMLPKRVAEFTNLESISSPLSSESLAPRRALWDDAISELRYSGNIVFGFGCTEITIDNGYLYVLYCQGIVGLAVFVAIWSWGLIRSTRGWMFARCSLDERYILLASGSFIVGSILFEITGEGMMFAKTGPIIAVFMSILQRPLNTNNYVPYVDNAGYLQP